MFERFTQRARQVVALAQDEAARSKHDLIGTEHLLLGLVREADGVAARVLKSLDITAERVRAQVEEIAGAGGELPSGQLSRAPSPDGELPDLSGSSLEQLDELIDELIDRELAISYERRVVHAKLDILWLERDDRRRGPHADH